MYANNYAVQVASRRRCCPTQREARRRAPCESSVTPADSLLTMTQSRIALRQPGQMPVREISRPGDCLQRRSGGRASETAINSLINRIYHLILILSYISELQRLLQSIICRECVRVWPAACCPVTLNTLFLRALNLNLSTFDHHVNEAIPLPLILLLPKLNECQ